MRPGRLNKRITLTPPGTGVDGWNQPVSAGGTPVVVWGGVSAVQVEDKVIGNAITSQANVQVFIRYRSDVDTTYTVTVEGVAYSVVHIAPTHKKRGLRLYLKSRE